MKNVNLGISPTIIKNPYIQNNVSRQLSQRYRNSRRKSADVIRKSKPHIQLQPSTASAPFSEKSNEDDDKENVESLQKLAKSRSAAAQTVQALLSATRRYRQTAFMKQRELSIHAILEQFPIFKEAKWVRKLTITWCDSKLVFFFPQLKYEFKEIVETDIAEVMAHNWANICKLLYPEKSENMTFSDEKQALQVLTKNLYHKKPPSLPLEVVQVH